MYSAALIGISAFAIAALAQDAAIAFTQFPPDTVTAGATVPLPYKAPDMNAAVTITLLKGCPNQCETDHVLTDHATGGAYTWNVDASQAPGTTYGLSISQGSASDYSNHFAIVAGASTSSSSSSSASSSSSTAATSSSSSTAATSSSSSATPVSQIGDNQPQAATSALASYQPISQISDNQPQAPTSAASAPLQMSSIISSAAAAATSYAASPSAASPAYGSAPAASRPTPASTPAAYKGAASNNKVGAGLMGLAGVAGVFAMM